jgi:hypothetical protein
VFEAIFLLLPIGPEHPSPLTIQSRDCTAQWSISHIRFCLAQSSLRSSLRASHEVSLTRTNSCSHGVRCQESHLVHILSIAHSRSVLFLLTTVPFCSRQQTARPPGTPLQIGLSHTRVRRSQLPRHSHSVQACITSEQH